MSKIDALLREFVAIDYPRQPIPIRAWQAAFREALEDKKEEPPT